MHKSLAERVYIARLFYFATVEAQADPESIQADEGFLPWVGLESFWEQEFHNVTQKDDCPGFLDLF